MIPSGLDISPLYRRPGTSFATSFTAFVKPPQYSAFNSSFIGEYGLSNPRRFGFSPSRIADCSALPSFRSCQVDLNNLRSRQAIQIRYDLQRLWQRFVQCGLHVAHLSCPCHFSLLDAKNEPSHRCHRPSQAPSMGFFFYPLRHLKLFTLRSRQSDYLRSQIFHFYVSFIFTFVHFFEVGNMDCMRHGVLAWWKSSSF
jgi:hypothetical protein